MPRLPSASISEHFATLTDPRAERGTEHLLVDILTITLCAVIRGADDWVAVATFGRTKAAWLRTFLALPDGIPSHDPFGRVFRLLDPEELRRCFLGWVRAVVGEAPADREPGGLSQQVVAVDGKTLRRSHDRGAGKEPLHLVSAWATEHGLVVGQVATDAKSNGITAIPALPRLLALEGATVTADAMGCQTAIASPIVEQGADYVLALKGNQPTLREHVRLAFADADAAAGTTLPLADLAAHTTVEKDHGRIERRRCRAVGDPDYLAFIDPDRARPKLRSVVCIESTRRIGDAASTEARHYLSSLPADAALLQRDIRSHWGVENRLHWALALAFHEDGSRVRADHAPENLVIIRHLALNLLRRDPSRRIGLKNARFRAALDDAYLRSILDAVSAVSAPCLRGIPQALLVSIHDIVRLQGLLRGLGLLFHDSLPVRVPPPVMARSSTPARPGLSGGRQGRVGPPLPPAREHRGAPEISPGAPSRRGVPAPGPLRVTCDPA